MRKVSVRFGRMLDLEEDQKLVEIMRRHGATVTRFPFAPADIPGDRLEFEFGTRVHNGSEATRQYFLNYLHAQFDVPVEEIRVGHLR